MKLKFCCLYTDTGSLGDK